MPLALTHRNKNKRLKTWSINPNNLEPLLQKSSEMQLEVPEMSS